jgi:hypothetical protein
MFAEAEARAVRSAIEAAIAVNNTEVAFGDAIRTNLTSASRKAYGKAARALIRTARDTTAAAYALLGGLPDESASRADQLEAAWAYVDRAVEEKNGTLVEAQEAVRGLMPIAGLVEARGRLRNLNRDALLHSDPPVEPGLVAGRRPIIAGHGDYHAAQHYGWSATHYMQDWAADAFVPVLVGVSTKYREALAGAWKSYAILVTYHIHCAGLIAGIPLYWQWERLGPFSMTLKSLHRLQTALDPSLDGIPEWYAAHGDEWDKVDVPTSLQSAYRRGNQRVRDSWRRSNKTAWLHNLFLDGRGETAK